MLLQRDVAVLLRWQALPLVTQAAERLDYRRAGLCWSDHRVEVSAFCCYIRIGQGIFVFGRARRPDRRLIAFTRGGQFTPVQDIDRALSPHDGDLRRRPRDVDVTAEVLGAHAVVRAAVGLPGGPSDLGYRCLSVGVD